MNGWDRHVLGPFKHAYKRIGIQSHDTCQKEGWPDWLGGRYCGRSQGTAGTRQDGKAWQIDSRVLYAVGGNSKVGTTDKSYSGQPGASRRGRGGRTGGAHSGLQLAGQLVRARLQLVLHKLLCDGLRIGGQHGCRLVGLARDRVHRLWRLLGWAYLLRRAIRSDTPHESGCHRPQDRNLRIIARMFQTHAPLTRSSLCGSKLSRWQPI